MTNPSTRSLLLALPFTLALVAPESTAQVPVGWAAVSRFQFSGGAPGGLSLVDLSGTGAVQNVTGLPSELVSLSNPSNEAAGSGCVLVDGRTGNLVVGEHVEPNGSLDIHLLSLAGTAFASDTVYHLGTVLPTWTGSVDQMAWLGDDILFSVRGPGLVGGPLAGHHVGILRPRLGPPGTPGTVVPIPLTGVVTGNTNGLALDEATGRAWIALLPSSTRTEIYELDVPGNGTAQRARWVASMNAEVRSLEYHEGVLLAGATGPTTLWRIDLSSTPATVTAVRTTGGNVNAFARENGSGDLFLVDSVPAVIRRVDAASGATTTIAGVTGSPSGIAIRQSLDTFGPASPGANDYAWVLGPNPGGSPTVGNANFALTVSSTPGTETGYMALGLFEAAPPIDVVGFTLLLAPGTMLIAGVLPPASQASFPLPIPASPALIGQPLFAQCAFVESSRLVGTRGLRITVER